MITKFKIFESNIPLDEDDLAQLFSQKYIEDYYDNNFKIDVEDAARTINLWNYVDEDVVKKTLIEESIDGYFIDDKIFTLKDYYNYIKENILELVIPELDKFRKKHNLGDIKYEEILRSMKKEDFVKLIAEYEKSDDFLKYYFEEKWEDSSAEEILMEIYGKHEIVDNSLYPYLREYIKDEQEIIDDYFDRVNFTDKFEYICDCIAFDITLQKELIKINQNTVEALFEIMNADDENRNVGKDYEFQKIYITYECMDEENLIPIYLKEIKEKFGLNPKIEKEYKDYMFEIDAEKYNL